MTTDNILPLIDLLCQQIEASLSHKMRTPKDFDYLQLCVAEKLKENISTSTLKRIWGYLPRNATIRESTLDIMARFADYADWGDFCNRNTAGDKPSLAVNDNSPGNTDNHPTSEPTAETPSTSATRSRSMSSWGVKFLFLFLLLFCLIAGGITLFRSEREDSPSEPHSDLIVLHKGQRFSSPHDYLQLFGIKATERLWGREVPHHPALSVWGPEYHHPKWHNDGDSALLMPTITEWWEPESPPVTTRTLSATAET